MTAENKSNIQKILFITLSNIGDVILTTPALNALHEEFPQAKFTVIVGPKCADLFEADPLVEKIIVYKKNYSFRELILFVRRLRSERFDAVADMRHTLFPFLIGARRLTTLIRGKKRHQHAVLDHMSKLKFLKRIDPGLLKFRVIIPHKAQEFQKELWSDYRIKGDEYAVGIAPHAASTLKMWYPSNFIELMQMMKKEYRVRFIIVGADDAREICDLVKEGFPEAINLVGKTGIPELAAVISKCNLFIANDSGPLHFATAYGIPTVAIFGPSNQERYGPFGNKHVIVHKDLSCKPCDKAQCPAGRRDCIDLITPKDVMNAVRQLLPNGA